MEEESADGLGPLRTAITRFSGAGPTRSSSHESMRSNVESLHESIPDEDGGAQDDTQDVAQGDGQDVWDTTLEKYGAAVVYRTATGERKLLPEFSVATLTGMRINELTEIRVMKQTLLDPTWQRLITAAREENKTIKLRMKLMDQYLALIKAIRAADSADSAFIYKLIDNVQHKLYVIPAKINARELSATTMGAVIKDKEAAASLRALERKEVLREQRLEADVEKSLVGRRKRRRGDEGSDGG